MTLSLASMTDMMFDLAGDSLPADYHVALWHELVRIEPALAHDGRIGLLPLRTAETGELHLLPKRAKLTLRVPHEQAQATLALVGARLDVSGHPIILGAGKSRPLQPYPTLHAHLVAGDTDEVVFMQQVVAELAELGVQAQSICGRPGRLCDGGRTIAGFSLVLHDLKPEASLRLQCAGMGKARHYGCGVFVPYKAISSLE